MIRTAVQEREGRILFASAVVTVLPVDGEVMIGSCAQRRFGCLKKLFNFLRGLENGRFPILVFGPESVSYERSRHENRTILREISARAFL